jgi:hypothetical protein
MKKLFIALSILAATSAAAQTKVTIDSEGNYHAIKSEVASHDSTTTKTFTDQNGKAHPVYKGKKGAYYICRISKAGNYYRQYLHSGTAVIGHESGVKN